MKTNLLIALANIIQNPVTDLIAHYQGTNRANNMGDALEVYIKDLFCNSFDNTDNSFYNHYFSYLGNTNNPPDVIIKDSDAIEVKKIESFTSALALNSSYPKNKLFSNDTRITEACRQCEDTPWTQKDIIYSIGFSPKKSNKLKALCFIYGDCYAAEKLTYQRIADKISQGIQEIPDVDFIHTNELAKVKKVDPLGITDLRVRGMWHIENPFKVFKSYLKLNEDNDFSVHALILTEKYQSFPEKDREKIEHLTALNIINIQIPSPNNPAKLLDAKYIHYAQ